jgi:hypothetical protein
MVISGVFWGKKKKHIAMKYNLFSKPDLKYVLSDPTGI